MGFNKSSFKDIWEAFDDLELSENLRRVCRFAQAFSDWTDRALDFHQDLTIGEVQKAKVLLIDKYFDFFIVVPKRHRYHFSTRGHVCIFHVFLEAYWQLKACELSLVSPRVLMPPPPSPPPQIAGIFLGEEE